MTKAVTPKNFFWQLIKAEIKLIKNLCYNTYQIIKYIVVSAYRFLGPVTGSVYNHINPEELYRVLTLAVSAGGGTWGTLQFLLDNVDQTLDKVWAPPVKVFLLSLRNNYAVLGVIIMVFILDLMRRKYQSDGVASTKDKL